MSAPLPNPIDQAFRVTLGRHLFSGFISCTRRLWIQLAKLETRIVADELEDVSIDRPIYVAGLARSGSTILLEALAAHPEVATHQYCDFPMLWTPYWWQQILRRTPHAEPEATERAHLDGLMVTPQSPEAMEEMLWMAFFRHAHDPLHSNVLDHNTDHQAFERFYREHMRKLLLIRRRARYAAKGNYNVARLLYLLKLFPDARIILPVRQPLHHIASLMKQHRLFTEGETRYPRALTHMRRVGHYEFGLDRRPMNLSDTETVQQICDLWQTGDEVRGWARYWAHVHGWLADQLEQHSPLHRATTVIRFEDVCGEPADALRRLLEHCRLEAPKDMVKEFAAQIHAPTYYRPDFTPHEQAIITEETESAAKRFGL